MSFTIFQYPIFIGVTVELHESFCQDASYHRCWFYFSIRKEYGAARASQTLHFMKLIHKKTTAPWIPHQYSLDVEQESCY